MTSQNPTLVIALYNRSEPAQRLFKALSDAVYPNEPVDMVISIDNDNNQNRDIVDLAESFDWKYGSKEVIYHEKNLGLRDHFNFCGGLTEKYGSIIFLEDDLFVSKYYYDYTLQALDFYKDDPHVAGISLFNYNRIEQRIDPWPFTAIDDGYDNYFLQLASWGQIWTDEMWRPFKEWFKVNGKPEIINSFDELPRNIKRWPNSSWKKNYIAYMILHGKYFVFPRISLACNFDDPGTHRKSETVYYQSPLLINKKKFRFGKFKDSLSVYDSFFEILPHILKKFNPLIRDYDFQVNLYGNKEVNLLKSQYIISKIPGKKNEMSFNLVMKPHELNIMFNQPGQKIFLTHKSELEPINLPKKFAVDFIYFYRNALQLKEMGHLLTYRVQKKLKSRK